MANGSLARGSLVMLPRNPKCMYTEKMKVWANKGKHKQLCPIYSSKGYSCIGERVTGDAVKVLGDVGP